MYFLDNKNESETTKNIKNEIVKQFSDSNNSWLKSKNSKSVIPEKGMYLYYFCNELLNICIQDIGVFSGEAG